MPWGAGVRRIMAALRGDPPGGVGTPYRAAPNGYANAAGAGGRRRVIGFEISVAVHPETHPNKRVVRADIDNFKRKLAAGATRRFGNSFFDETRS